jgi:hypothetical protein
MWWCLTENTHRCKAVTSCAWTGFGAVPAGYRNNNGAQFYHRGINAVYWSSAVGSNGGAWYRSFNYGNAQVERNLNRSNGFSVRCVRESKRHKHQRIGFFVSISLVEKLFRIFVEKSVLWRLCTQAGVGMVTAMPSAPLESGNPPS